MLSFALNKEKRLATREDILLDKKAEKFLMKFFSFSVPCVICLWPSTKAANPCLHMRYIYY
jgi:hypothetical protein